jgi:hypothetical protein
MQLSICIMYTRVHKIDELINAQGQGAVTSNIVVRSVMFIYQSFI